MATKKLNIEGRTYYFYNDLIKIKNFNGQWCLLYWLYNKKSTMAFNSVNPLYLMIKKINGYYEEVDGDKYLIISSENIHIMQKYQEVFDEMQKSYAKSYEF